MNISKAKLLLVALTLTAANLATAGNSQTYVAQNDLTESKICVAAATGSNSRMNSTIKQMLPTKLMHTKYTLVANKLKCNGMNVADFAEQAGNIEVANKLKSYRTKNVKIQDIAAIDTNTAIING
ncbi:MAG: hypothetical protein ACJAVV_002214 [Alphaproteobacteria bacterium]|jgi:hypothetical protein